MFSPFPSDSPLQATISIIRYCIIFLAVLNACLLNKTGLLPPFPPSSGVSITSTLETNVIEKEAKTGVDLENFKSRTGPGICAVFHLGIGYKKDLLCLVET